MGGIQTVEVGLLLYRAGGEDTVRQGIAVELGAGGELGLGHGGNEVEIVAIRNGLESG